MAASRAGHLWVDDFSTSGQQHRQACQWIARKTVESDVDAVFWTEHDVVLPQDAVGTLVEALEEGGADIATGVTFRRCPPFAPMVSRLLKVSPEEYAKTKVDGIPKLKALANSLSFEEFCDTMLVSINNVDPQGEAFLVDAAPMTCLLVRRAAFEKVAPVPDLFAARAHLSIDNVFFTHCRKAGLKTVCDPRVICGHLGEPEIVSLDHWERYSSQLK